MNYVFFGTPSFAAIILERLVQANLIPKAVVCNPDRPVGRKKIVTAPPTKIIAQQNQIPIIQTERLEIQNLKKVDQVELAIVAAYSKILPKEIIQISKFGTIGVHPSLLPQYRGATPIQTAILNGDIETGVTLYLIDEKIDHGMILAQKKTSIENRNYQELEKHLAEISADLIIETLPKFLSGTIKPQTQNESKATYTKKFKSEDGFINPAVLNEAQNLGGQIAIKINRQIHALNPEPGVYTIQNNKRVKLLASEIKDKKLQITKLQMEGKKPVII